MTTPSDLLRTRLNLETARIAWAELQRPFARGVVVKVAPGLDLVDAAVHVAANSAEVIQEWLADGRIARAELADAEDWHARQPTFWAVVVAPWVLIQETAPEPDA